MLEIIRKYAQHKAVKFFLSVVALTFIAGFGITEVIRKIFGQDYVVKIGDEKIYPLEFKREKARKLNLIQPKDRGNLDDEQLTQSILHQLIWENIVNLASKEYGLLVSDNTMKRYISGMKVFRDANGRFNANLLRGFLHKIQVPEEMFLEASRREIKTAIIRAPLQCVSVMPELSTYVDAMTEKRSLRYVELKPASFKITETPTSEELKKFYDAHPNDFMIDETRSFKLLTIDESKLGGKIHISDDELQEAYELSPARDERSFDDMKAELAQDLRQEKLENIVSEFTRQVEDELTIDGDPKKVATKFQLKISEYTDILKDHKINLAYGKDVVNIAFSLEEGSDSSFSESLDASKNRVLWIVHLDKITPKHRADFTKIVAKVKEAWIKDKQYDAAIALANEWKAKSSDNAKLKQLAADMKRYSDVTPLFSKVDVKNSKHRIIKNLQDEGFNINHNEIAFKEVDNKVIVYQLDSVVANKEANPDDYKKYYGEYLTSVVDDMYQELVNYLSKKYKVTINRARLQEIQEKVNPNIELF